MHTLHDDREAVEPSGVLDGVLDGVGVRVGVLVGVSEGVGVADGGHFDEEEILVSLQVVELLPLADVARQKSISGHHENPLFVQTAQVVKAFAAQSARYKLNFWISLHSAEHVPVVQQ